MKKIGKCSCCFLILYTQYIRYFNYNLNFFFLEPPKVRVNYKETFPGITTLYCRAHGFYPPEISINWMKNGEEIVQDTNYGGILPSGDGTYQTWVSVELDSQNGDIYSCHVEHGGVHMVLPGFQDSETMLLVMKAVGFIVLAIALAGVGILAWRRRPRGKNKVIYLSTPDHWWEMAVFQLSLL